MTERDGWNVPVCTQEQASSHCMQPVHLSGMIFKLLAMESPGSPVFPKDPRFRMPVVRQPGRGFWARRVHRLLVAQAKQHRPPAVRTGSYQAGSLPPGFEQSIHEVLPAHLVETEINPLDGIIAVGPGAGIALLPINRNGR